MLQRNWFGGSGSISSQGAGTTDSGTETTITRPRLYSEEDDEVTIEPLFFQTNAEKEASWPARIWRNISEVVIQHADLPEEDPFLAHVRKQQSLSGTGAGAINTHTTKQHGLASSRPIGTGTFRNKHTDVLSKSAGADTRKISSDNGANTVGLLEAYARRSLDYDGFMGSGLGESQDHLGALISASLQSHLVRPDHVVRGQGIQEENSDGSGEWVDSDSIEVSSHMSAANGLRNTHSHPDIPSIIRSISDECADGNDTPELNFELNFDSDDGGEGFGLARQLKHPDLASLVTASGASAYETEIRNVGRTDCVVGGRAYTPTPSDLVNRIGEDYLVQKRVFDKQQVVRDDDPVATLKFLMICLAVAEFVFMVSLDDLKPIRRIAGDPRASTVRLNHTRADLLRSNPWLQARVHLYCEWWRVAATTQRIDVYAALLDDMKQFPEPPHVTTDVLFLRPHTLMAHVRNASTDGVSLASSMGRSFVSHTPETIHEQPSIEGDIIGALAMLSASPRASMGGFNCDTRSSNTNSTCTLDLDSLDLSVDGESHISDGSDTTSVGVRPDDQGIIPPNATFVLLDRNLSPVAKITGHQSNIYAHAGGVVSMGTHNCVAGKPLELCPNLEYTVKGWRGDEVPYVRKDIPVDFVCDIAFDWADPVPVVLRGATFTQARLDGTAVIVQKCDTGDDDVVPKSECVCIADLTVAVDENIRLGPYVCVSLVHFAVDVDNSSVAQLAP
ncbi:hypothetical protein SARC_09671 [Sphaeroforma arctica JP610]|uniref:Uncharacterized protein n=1 Tax=Sphaeroforma arctica JP610 TaxID=667725 RepID=A0A0L0FM97_9EUKA|nr:hypothetical protein SARC_09671 [Sphaeroforma arctica JP610]KNC77880.1 hypothetical protein SARC_09671 [Sphaeroforma arctica JP610]|eukprot:XP_014151782.1 hypothetical protein SARC_09671 [Sphaeroforma arctica JP610]